MWIPASWTLRLSLSISVNSDDSTPHRAVLWGKRNKDNDNNYWGLKKKKRRRKKFWRNSWWNLSKNLDMFLEACVWWHYGRVLTGNVKTSSWQWLHWCLLFTLLETIAVSSGVKEIWIEIQVMLPICYVTLGKLLLSLWNIMIMITEAIIYSDNKC